MMAEERNLSRRFAVGSNDLSWFTPGTPHHEFFIGIPQNVRALEQSGQRIVQHMSGMQRQLQTAYQEHIYAMNEISNQISGLQTAVAGGFADISDAVQNLEHTLSVELSEIKWVLGQMDARIAELVHLVRFPRETEARELVEDGVKALATNNLDDAEICLKQAVDRKRTSFQGHTNLAFLYLRRDRAEEALLHFRKAVDYSPADPGTRVFALENLARAHFAARDFTSARSIMAQAIELRGSASLRSRGSEYKHAVYCALAGESGAAVATICGLCREEPACFAVASTDQDLVGVRPRIIEALNALGDNENRKGRQLLLAAQAQMGKVVSSLAKPELVAPERDRLDSMLARSRAWLAEMDFSRSVKAVTACSAVVDAAPNLPEIANLRSQIGEATEELRTAETLSREASRRSELERGGARSAGKRVEAARDPLGAVGCCLGCLSAPILILLVSALVLSDGLAAWLRELRDAWQILVPPALLVPVGVLYTALRYKAFRAETRLRKAEAQESATGQAWREARERKRDIELELRQIERRIENSLRKARE